MATGRTKPKWIRVYMDGYDVSGYGRTIGPLMQSVDEVNLTVPMSDQVKGYLKGQSMVNVGVFNGVFDNTVDVGAHAILGTAGVDRDVIVAYGIRAEPAEGDPAFCGKFRQAAYHVANDANAVTVNVPFSGWDATAETLAYGAGWGQLVHDNAAETDVNAGTGFDNPTGAATDKGGFMVWEVLDGDGTATISIDDSANNIAFAALAGATTGEIDCSTPSSGIVALAVDADVRQYLRWQLSLNTANTVTFVVAFVRG